MNSLHFLFLTLLAYTSAAAIFTLRYSDILGMLGERVADETLRAQRSVPFYEAEPEIYLMRKPHLYLLVFVVGSWIFYPVIALITRITAQRLVRAAVNSGSAKLPRTAL